MIQKTEISANDDEVLRWTHKKTWEGVRKQLQYSTSRLGVQYLGVHCDHMYVGGMQILNLGKNECFYIKHSTLQQKLLSGWYNRYIHKVRGWYSSLQSRLFQDKQRVTKVFCLQHQPYHCLQFLFLTLTWKWLLVAWRSFSVWTIDLILVGRTRPSKRTYSRPWH